MRSVANPRRTGGCPQVRELRSCWKIMLLKWFDSKHLEKKQTSAAGFAETGS